MIQFGFSNEKSPFSNVNFIDDDFLKNVKYLNYNSYKYFLSYQTYLFPKK